jgi:hypothetical protein
MTATTAGTEPSLIETATSQFLGMALISLPNDIGAITLCPLSSSEAWPPNHWTAPRIQQCIGLRVVWGGAFLCLLALGLALEIREVLQLRRWKKGE